MTSLDVALRKRVPSIPASLKALDRMRRELSAAKTYDEIRRLIREASALKVLMGHVAEVKGKAEDTVLIGCRRIGEEINGVRKAAGPGRSKTFTGTGKCFSGRGSLNIPGTSRARLKKLASLPGQ